MEPKNIDRLFQEKLKDLELTPNPEIWNKIETSLTKKKKKRRAIVWYRFAGVAAVALLGIFIYNNVSVETKPNFEFEENTITNTSPILEETETKKVEKIISKPLIEEITTDSAPVSVANAKEVSPKINTKPIVHSKTITNFETTKIEHSEAKIAEENSNEKRTTKPSNSIFEKIEKEQTNSENENIALLKKEENKVNIADVLEEKIEKELIANSWAIAPTVSQLFSNTMSNRSSIDPRLNDANKKGNNSTSFGFRVSYKASRKWQFQTGIHKLELAQTTQNIRLATTVNASSIENSAFKPSTSEALASNPTFSFDKSSDLIDGQEGNINQSYGYIEIPLEVKYALLQSKKLEFHLVSGLSTLFLTKNNLQIETNTFSYSAGEANNLNDVNFTLNFGSNLEYHFDKKWYFDIAPMVKFQTNTFETRSNKPYFFGIYTGFNYKF